MYGVADGRRTNWDQLLGVWEIVSWSIMGLILDVESRQGGLVDGWMMCVGMDERGVGIIDSVIQLFNDSLVQ